MVGRNGSIDVALSLAPPFMSQALVTSSPPPHTEIRIDTRRETTSRRTPQPSYCPPRAALGHAMLLMHSFYSKRLPASPTACTVAPNMPCPTLAMPHSVAPHLCSFTGSVSLFRGVGGSRAGSLSCVSARCPLALRVAYSIVSLSTRSVGAVASRTSHGQSVIVCTRVIASLSAGGRSDGRVRRRAVSSVGPAAHRTARDDVACRRYGTAGRRKPQPELSLRETPSDESLSARGRVSINVPYSI
jgi:hypothetical protein